MRRLIEERAFLPVRRRQLMRLAGSAGLGLVALAAPGVRRAGRGLLGAGVASAQDGTLATCTLAPEQTEGPYYVDDVLRRRNITESRPGTPLWLTLRVVNASTCAAIPGSTVEIWHADANGDYSGYNGFQGEIFMRGQQITGDAGAATFRTVYPGWYTGRTVHIHCKVHVGGSTVHTGQLYFDDALTDAVYQAEPYASRGTRDTRNAGDDIYASGGAASLLAVERRGKGYWGSITLAVAS
ncbi:intradiol ring-cleavage dioxygenase [Candidatus Binatia bacterium]|jgi:protocatechuate 3,4-dioxygenase beta subunit|nr:intradiol ring-cleavage dioxygenase [Candidatus Binatia bacterium]